jgi:hypothetical protein
MTTTNNKATKPQAQSPQDCLVGKFFHTTTICPSGLRIAKWQGHIVGAPAPGVLLIETFEWLMGEPWGQEFITLDDFMAKNPILYADEHEMHFAYEHGAMRHHCDDKCDGSP